MSNETLFFISAGVTLFSIAFAVTQGKRWIFALIAINLILASMLGGKLLSVFGFVINAGNVAYACVFFATHVLIERYGKEEGYRTIWFGAVMVLFFTIATQLARLSNGLSDTSDINNAMTTLFQLVPRITVASLFAYVIAQYCNVALYGWLKDLWEDRLLFVRVVLVLAVAQLIDSSLFVSIAFFGLLSVPVILQNIYVGCFSKVFVGACATPILAWARSYKK